MQATTILMYFVGLALWYANDHIQDAESEIEKIISFLDQNDFSFIADFVKKESELYQQGKYLFYATDGELGISILTDTTERSPTFSLYPFENQNDDHKNPSLSYLLFSHVETGELAWEELLKRKPRAFHWQEVTNQTSLERLKGFDFSKKLLQVRPTYLKAEHATFTIKYNREKNALSFNLENLNYELALGDLNFLSAHMILKILLNTHSTLVMGRLNRYESNLMTWVRASNFKLIDRTVRYVHYLLNKRGVEASYEDLVYLCFELKDQVPRDQSLVLKMVERTLEN